MYLNITLIYVTHDQTEAMSMADKIVLMNEGEIVQNGRPKELYEKPENTFTAKFLGNPPMNLINLEVESGRKYIPIFEEKYFIKQNSAKKNILGMMPHPERMVDEMVSNEDGINLFSSLLN